MTVSWIDAETLDRLYVKEGLSATRIAEMYGVTRGAACGYIHRLGLKRQTRPGTATAAQRAQRERVKQERAAPFRPAAATPERPSPASRDPSTRGGAEPALGSRGPGTSAQANAGPAPEEVEAPVPAEVWQPLKGFAPVPLVARRDDQCSWPIDGEGGQALCCGAAAAGVYCLTHTRMSQPKAGTKAALDKRLGIPRRAA